MTVLRSSNLTFDHYYKLVIWCRQLLKIIGSFVLKQFGKGMSRSALFVGPEPFSGQGDLNFEAEIRNEVKAKNSQFWKETRGRPTTELLRDFTTTGPKVGRGLCQKSITFMKGFLTVHCSLKGHSHLKLEILDDASCILCGAKEETL